MGKFWDILLNITGAISAVVGIFGKVDSGSGCISYSPCFVQFLLKLVFYEH